MGTSRRTSEDPSPDLDSLALTELTALWPRTQVHSEPRQPWNWLWVCNGRNAFTQGPAVAIISHGNNTPWLPDWASLLKVIRSGGRRAFQKVRVVIYHIKRTHLPILRSDRGECKDPNGCGADSAAYATEKIRRS